MGSWTKRSFLARALRLALVSCAILAGGLVLTAGRASAAEGVGPVIVGPVIGHVTATEIAEHEVKVEAQIDPGGLETVYEIRLVWQEADPKGGPTNDGERPTGGAQTQTGHIAAGPGDQTVSATLIGLQWGYTYWYVVAAINSAGQTRGESPYTFALHISGEFPDGEGTGPPYESEIPIWFTKLSEEESAETLKEYEVKHAKELEAQHAKEHEEQAFKEAVARAAEAAALKQREEQEQDKGGLSLAATSVTVGRDGTALVKLECLGIASCRGKLTLTAKSTVKVKGEKKTHMVPIATVSFSIPGDETKAVKVKLDAAGRALLSADHGRLSAGLTLLKYAPAPSETHTDSVHLVQQKAHGMSSSASLGIR